MIERTRPLFGVKRRRHVHKTGEHRQALAPACITVACAKAKAHAERFDGVAPVFHQVEDRLAQEQREIPLQPHFQPFALLRQRIRRGGEVDPDLAAAHLDRIGRHVVGPEIKTAAARQVEAA